MKITKKWLEKNNACEPGLKWFCAQKERDVKKICDKLVSEEYFEWANWLVVQLMSRKHRMQYAVFAAEQVIEIYEKKYPGDNRPRKAIEAAKRCIENDTEENRAATYAAADAAWSAADAARAAAKEAWAAATYAAAEATDAAAAATYAAADAARAAARAAATYAAAAARAAAAEATYAAADAAWSAADAARAAAKAAAAEATDAAAAATYAAADAARAAARAAAAYAAAAADNEMKTRIINYGLELIGANK